MGLFPQAVQPDDGKPSSPVLVSLVLSVRLPQFPRLIVRASSAFSEELCRQVLTSQLDVALVASGIPDARLNFLEVADNPLYAVFPNQENLARSRTIPLDHCQDRVWILFARQVHSRLYDQVRGRAAELGIRPREIHHITTAEQAAYLIRQHNAIAFLTEAGAWRIAREGLAMRPFEDAALMLKTVIITRSEDRTQLTSEFVRAAMIKLQKTGMRRSEFSLAG